MSAGKLIGVGVGPGDPELMTLKAMRALGEADVIAHFAKAGNESHSRAIAAQHLRAEVIELPLLYPITTELPTDSNGYRDAIGDFYDGAATAIAAYAAGHWKTAAGQSEIPLLHDLRIIVGKTNRRVSDQAE